MSRLQLSGAVNLHPIRCRRGGVFHPKLVFLRWSTRPRLLRIRQHDGRRHGLESRTLDRHGVARDPGRIQHFLLALTRSSDLAIDDGACRSLRRAISGLVGTETASVWSSLQESFAQSAKKRSGAKCCPRIIISPMYAGEGGIKAVRTAIPSSKVDLIRTWPSPCQRVRCSSIRRCISRIKPTTTSLSPVFCMQKRMSFVLGPAVPPWPGWAANFTAAGPDEATFQGGQRRTDDPDRATQRRGRCS